MKDKLKDHIKENLPQFELYQTDIDSIWDNIEKTLDNEQKKNQFQWKPFLKIAASIVLIFVVGFTAIRFANNSQKYQDGVSLAEISPELAEAEFYYSRLVDEKFALIRSVNNQLDPLIAREIGVLDSDYQDLKKDLKDNMDNEEVINAMIQNYRLKLQILEQILDNIKPNEKEKNEEGISI